MKLLSLILGVMIAVSARAVELPGFVAECPLYLEVAIVGTDRVKTGTGFLLSTSNRLFLITAKHVLFDVNSTAKPLPAIGTNLIVTGLTTKREKSDPISINLGAYAASGAARYSATSDIAVFYIGIVKSNISGTVAYTTDDKYISGQIGAAGIVPIEMVTKFDDVRVGNDVFTFGYPTSIGTRFQIQLDRRRPLAKKGIVSDKEPIQKKIVLDLPVFFGNSGGPVIGVLRQNLGTISFGVIGVVTQYIPFEDMWVNEHLPNFPHIMHSNSGYSIAEPMDRVVEMLW